MRIATLFLLIFSLEGIYGQVLVRGRVLDAASAEGLSYVNIGIPGAGIGTVSRSDGHFELIIPDSFAHDSLKFSMVGYAPLTL